jgi:hypothetical protein
MATTWVFERGAELLHVQRQDVLGELRLVIWGTNVDERTQIFDDEVQLVACMTALDTHLVGDGWSLADFFPERRSGHDRPSLPRSAERRRNPRPTRYTGCPDVDQIELDPGPLRA